MIPEEAATDFELSPRTVELQENLLEFMDAHVYPAEQTWLEQVAASGDPYFHPPVMEELKESRAGARAVEPVPPR